MRQVEVDALDVGVLLDDHVEGSSDSSPDVDEDLDVLEATVGLEDLLGDDGGVVPHAFVEHLVEPGVCAVVLECRHPVGLVEWDASIQHCILQVVPIERASKNFIKTLNKRRGASSSVRA